MTGIAQEDHDIDIEKKKKACIINTNTRRRFFAILLFMIEWRR